MKRIYLLALAVCAFGLNTNAQILIDDNMDFYTPGPMGDQAPWWTNWSGTTGTAEDIQVVTDQSNTAPQSGFIGPGGATPDALLLLGNQTTGQYTVQWQAYVPSGATGYWNIQDDETPGMQWNADFYVDATASGGSAGKVTHDQSGADVDYPNDQWFLVRQDIDLDAQTFSVWIDGAALVTDEAYPGTQLGSIDFFSIDANNSMYVDDVLYNDGFLGGDDFNAASFTVYPNPVQDILNIETAAVVDSINVYDVLGKLVLQAQPDTVSPSIDMSALSSGAYMVQVTIGNASKTVKVVK